MSPQPENRTSSLSIINFVLLLVVLGLLAVRFWPEIRPGGGADPNAQPRPIDPRGDLAADEKTNIDIFDQCAASSVNVQTFANVRRDPFDLNVLKIPRGSGTGIIWDEDGHIVSNYHVIAAALQTDGSVNAGLIQVTLADHKSYSVYDVNFARDKDLAVLWINAPKNALRKIKIGESKNLKVGQKVWAIGNPFGLDQSLTTGIISALGRDIQPDENAPPIRGLIQTDAAINPGNSGGPLLDSAGRLIGVNTAIVSPSGASAGIGFAIPIDEVNREVTQLIRKEKRVRPVLGIYIAPENIVRDLGLDGILVLKVVPGGPADEAGIQPTIRTQDKVRLGDIIVAIDKKEVRSRVELAQVLEDNYMVGQEVTVTLVRDPQGERRRLDVKLTLTGSPR
jgi:S1-C subfamily serine protease